MKTPTQKKKVMPECRKEFLKRASLTAKRKLWAYDWEMTEYT